MWGGGACKDQPTVRFFFFATNSNGKVRVRSVQAAPSGRDPSAAAAAAPPPPNGCHPAIISWIGQTKWLHVQGGTLEDVTAI